MTSWPGSSSLSFDTQLVRVSCHCRVVVARRRCVTSRGRARSRPSPLARLNIRNPVIERRGLREWWTSSCGLVVVVDQTGTRLRNGPPFCLPRALSPTTFSLLYPNYTLDPTLNWVHSLRDPPLPGCARALHHRGDERLRHRRVACGRGHRVRGAVGGDGRTRRGGAVAPSAVVALLLRTRTTRRERDDGGRQRRVRPAAVVRAP